MGIEEQFDAALEWLLAIEGGYVNDPDDPGGATFAGVSLRAVVGLRDSNGELEFDLDGDGDVDADDIAALKHNPAKVALFYRERYWNKVCGDLLKWPLNLLAFDAAVHSGPRVAAVLLQKAVGAKADGVIGPETISKSNSKRGRAMLNTVKRYMALRAKLFSDIAQKRPASDKFLVGWMRRLFELYGEAQRRVG